MSIDGVPASGKPLGLEAALEVVEHLAEPGCGRGIGERGGGDDAVSRLHAGVVAGVVGKQWGGRRCRRGVFDFSEDFEPGVELSAVGWGDVEFAVQETGEHGVGAGDAVGEAGYMVDPVREFEGIVVEVEVDGGWIGPAH